MSEETRFTLVGLENFDSEVTEEEKAVLLVYISCGSESREQLKMLEYVARIYGGVLKVCLLEEGSVEPFRETLGIEGGPTFLLFYGGAEKDRMLGRADYESLEHFISRNLYKVRKRLLQRYAPRKRKPEARV